MNMNAYHSVWNEYGYRESIFSPNPIKVQEDQRKLLVGRESELASIKQQLKGGASVVPLEGDYGVGKTSLASAVMYDLAHCFCLGLVVSICIEKSLYLSLSSRQC